MSRDNSVALSPKEQSAYRDQLLASPVLDVTEWRRLVWLLQYAPR